jgi:hypothetical protein
MTDGVVARGTVIMGNGSNSVATLGAGFLPLPVTV